MIRFQVLLLVAMVSMGSLDALVPTVTISVNPMQQTNNDGDSENSNPSTDYGKSDSVNHKSIWYNLPPDDIIVQTTDIEDIQDVSGLPDDFPNVEGWPNVPTNFKFDHPIQSPIDVITSISVTKPLPVLDIIETHLKGQKAIIYNSGHTAYVYIRDNLNRRPYLVGGPLKTKFIFEQMHFHWGSEDLWGSEHFIDGQSFAVEIHMVHFNSKYQTFKNAADKPEGLAVLAIFAEATTVNNTLLKPFENLLPKIQGPRSKALIDAWDGMKWAASALSTNIEYYAYPGSLTTSPYTENVHWIVLPKPITLSHEQLSTFRQLHSDVEVESEFIIDNKRNLQPLFQRPIVRSVSLQ